MQTATYSLSTDTICRTIPFGTLDNYADKSFWEDNKTFTFATVYEKREYQVFAAIKTKILQAGETPRSFLFSAYRNKINNVEEDGTLNILKYNIQTEARKYFNK